MARFIEFQHNQAGCPDIMVSYRGQMWLMELKVRKGRLSDAQKKFAAEWQGPPILVIRSVSEALIAIGLTPLPEEQHG